MSAPTARKPTEPEYQRYDELFAQLPNGKVQCYNEWIGGKPNNTETGTLGYLPEYIGPPEGIAQTPELVGGVPAACSRTSTRTACANHSYYVNVPYLRELQPYPWVKINPATAEAVRHRRRRLDQGRVARTAG